MAVNLQQPTLRTWKILSVVWLYVFSLSAFSSEADQQLDKFFTEVDSLKGQFQQTVYDENGAVVQAAKGSVALDKPGRFRWQYTQPYRQLILADSEYLWIYDEELLQATARPVEDVLGNVPIMLLTDGRPLHQDFEVKSMAARDGLDWVELIPFAEDTEFHRIHVGVDEKGIRKMELYDYFAQKTVIEFMDIETNVSFPPGYFNFEAPEGVDVAGYPVY